MCDFGVVGRLLLIRDHILRHDWAIYNIELGQLVDKLAEDTLHANTRIFRIPYTSVCAMEINCP